VSDGIRSVIYVIVNYLQRVTITLNTSDSEMTYASMMLMAPMFVTWCPCRFICLFLGSVRMIHNAAEMLYNECKIS
jgi:hypothetical protein